MTQAELIASPPTVAVEGLPRLDRYFPECRAAAIEAVARFRFGVKDFGKIYGWHTFRYVKASGPIRFRPNGVELELKLHRSALHEEEFDAKIDDIYGIQSKLIKFVRFDDYMDYCIDCMARGIPVVSTFDLWYLKQRREYGKIRSEHVIVLHAYDAENRIMKASEQMLSDTLVGMDDLVRCFEYRVQTDGAMSVWDVFRAKDERRLTKAEVLASITFNLENLTSSDASWGLGALARFREELEAYLTSDAFGDQPFAVPGLWVFSHERHILRKWLEGVAHLCADAELLRDFDAILERLFKRWLAVDYLLEKCLLSKDGRTLRRLPKYFSDIHGDELQTIERWQKLRAWVEKAAES